MSQLTDRILDNVVSLAEHFEESEATEAEEKHFLEMAKQAAFQSTDSVALDDAA